MTPLEKLLRRMGAKEFVPAQEGGYVGVIWGPKAVEVLPLLVVNLETTPFEETDKEIRIGSKGKELLILRKPLPYQP